MFQCKVERVLEYAFMGANILNVGRLKVSVTTIFINSRENVES